MIIGYGFGDDQINERIQKHLLDRAGTRLLVVEIKPHIPDDFKESSEYFKGGVCEFDDDQLLSAIVDRTSTA